MWGKTVKFTPKTKGHIYGHNEIIKSAMLSLIYFFNHYFFYFTCTHSKCSDSVLFPEDFT